MSQNHQKRDLIYFVKMDFTTNLSTYEAIHKMCLLQEFVNKT